MRRGSDDECCSNVMSADFSRRGRWGTPSQAPCTYTIHTPIVSTIRSEMRADLKTVERTAACATIKNIMNFSPDVTPLVRTANIGRCDCLREGTLEGIGLGWHTAGTWKVGHLIDSRAIAGVVWGRHKRKNNRRSTQVQAVAFKNHHPGSHARPCAVYVVLVHRSTSFRR